MYEPANPNSAEDYNHFGATRSRQGGMIVSTLLCLTLFSISFSQSQPTRTNGSTHAGTAGTAPQSESEASGQNSSRDEMLRNVEVKRREAVYKENLERARESAELGADILQAYQNLKVLRQDELKKMARMEKLTRSIRNDNGGGDDEDAIKDPPKDLSHALTRLVEMSEELKKRVEKTPKHVVSTSVINSANRLLELIRFIRTLS